MSQIRPNRHSKASFGKGYSFPEGLSPDPNPGHRQQQQWLSQSGYQPDGAGLTLLLAKTNAAELLFYSYNLAESSRIVGGNH